jgi:hypothetical protein
MIRDNNYKIIKERKAKKKLRQDINNFLNSLNEQLLANEKMIVNDEINRTFQR